MNSTQGIRHNQGKPQWSQIDFKALEPMVRVLEQGGEKVGRDNWKKGLLVRETIESLLRHTFALLAGEDNDHESKQPHIGHILSNAMFISYMLQNRPDMDNRRGRKESNDDQFNAPETILKFAMSNRRGLDCFPDEYADKKLTSDLGVIVGAHTITINAGTTVRDAYSRIAEVFTDNKEKPKDGTLSDQIAEATVRINEINKKIIEGAKAAERREPRGGVLDESNFRQIAQDFANRLRNHKEEPPKMTGPVPVWPPKQSRFQKAMQKFRQQAGRGRSLNTLKDFDDWKVDYGKPNLWGMPSLDDHVYWEASGIPNPDISAGQNANIGRTYPKDEGCTCGGKICGVQPNGEVYYCNHKSAIAHVELLQRAYREKQLSDLKNT